MTGQKTHVFTFSCDDSTPIYRWVTVSGLSSQTLLHIFESGIQNVLRVRNTLLRRQGDAQPVEKTGAMLRALETFQVTNARSLNEAGAFPTAQAGLHQIYVHSPFTVERIIISNNTGNRLAKTFYESFSPRTRKKIQGSTIQRL